MTADMSIIGLLLGASVPVQIVMLLLIGASVVSWSIIFTKRRLIRRTTESSDEFEAAFWSGGDLNTLYQSATRAKSGSIGMSRIFEAGFREFNRGLQAGDSSPNKISEECRRGMRVAQMREMDRLEQNLATLATIGSTSPYMPEGPSDGELEGMTVRGSRRATRVGYVFDISNRVCMIWTCCKS